MIIADIRDNELINMLAQPNPFERNKILVYNVGKSTVQYWATKFKEFIVLSPEKIKRVAITRLSVDKACLKSNGVRCYLFAAIDVDRNKLLKGLPSEEFINSLFLERCFKALRS